MSNNFLSSNFLRWLTLYLLLALAILLFIANLYNTPNTSANPAKTPTPTATPSKHTSPTPNPSTPKPLVSPTSTSSSTPTRTPSPTNLPTPSPTPSSKSNTTTFFISQQSGDQRNWWLLSGVGEYLRTCIDHRHSSSNACFHNSEL